MRTLSREIDYQLVLAIEVLLGLTVLIILGYLIYKAVLKYKDPVFSYDPRVGGYAAEAINKVISSYQKNLLLDTNVISNGQNTFGELNNVKDVQLAVIANLFSDKAWKTKKNTEGQPVDEDSFIVGIDTPEGLYCACCDLRSWGFFEIKEIPHAPQACSGSYIYLNRLLSLKKEGEVH